MFNYVNYLRNLYYINFFSLFNQVYLLQKNLKQIDNIFTLILEILREESDEELEGEPGHVDGLGEGKELVLGAVPVILLTRLNTNSLKSFSPEMCQ